MISQLKKLTLVITLAVHESVENFLRDVSEIHNFDLSDLREYFISKFNSVKRHVECGGLTIKLHNANLNELYLHVKAFNKEKIDCDAIRDFLYFQYNQECWGQGIHEKVYGAITEQSSVTPQ